MIQLNFLLCDEVLLERRRGAGPEGARYDPGEKQRCRLSLHPGGKYSATAVFGPEVRLRPGDRIRTEEALLQVCTVEEATDLRGRLHHSEVKLA